MIYTLIKIDTAVAYLFMIYSLIDRLNNIIIIILVSFLTSVS